MYDKRSSCVDNFVDNTLSSQKEVHVMNDKDVSALYYVRHTAGRSRLMYAVYTICGVLFYGVGVFTFLGFAMRMIHGGEFLSLETVVLSCYMLLNCLVGYGFMFHRKWLITVFEIVLAFMGGMTMVFLSSGFEERGNILLWNVFITIGILIFLFASKHVLSGKYIASWAILSFTIALLLSFVLTNLGMLN